MELRADVASPTFARTRLVWPLFSERLPENRVISLTEMLFLILLTTAPAAAFPFHGATFDAFVRESYRVVGRKDPNEFYRTMDDRAQSASLPSWAQWAAVNRANGRPDQAREAGAQVWKRIKKTITKFSLDRGFEFANVVATNERQCYLQSIIVAGGLQRAGYKAGVAMVWSNPKGQTSNNGHAVAVVKAGARDIVVDCSEPKPFEVHKGLFLPVDGAYRYVEPIYNAQEWITGYRIVGTGQTIAPAKAGLLDLGFLKSQFDYYRGERVQGGVISKLKTKAGLAASEKFYRRSLAECPANPLTRAMLVRTLALQGRSTEAEAQRKQALSLYAAYGWTPKEVQRPVLAAAR